MIREQTERLLAFAERDWEKYAFSREALAGKLTPAQRYEFYQKSTTCGVRLARELRMAHGVRTIEEYAALCGVRPRKLPLDNSGSYTVFARFTEPDEIIIYTDNARQTDERIDSENLRDLLGDFETENVLLAHELYHYLEDRRGDLFTSQKHLLLWKLGPFRNESGIGCLSELGAMAFAKELCALQFHPYVLDVLMLLPTNAQRAGLVYQSMVAWSETEQNKEAFV